MGIDYIEYEQALKIYEKTVERVVAVWQAFAMLVAYN